MAPCSACYLVLRKTQDYIERYPEIGRRVKDSLHSGGLPALDVRERPPSAGSALHDVGPAKIRSKVVRQWHGGQVACYYGCQFVRPYGEADRDHDPMRMDELLQRRRGVRPWSIR